MTAESLEALCGSNQDSGVLSTVTVLDDSLVQRCVAGDAQAWRALHRRYFPVAASFLRKLGTPQGDIEDACQDVFVELFRYLPTFRGQADFKTWLYRLCVTQARRLRNRSKISRVVRERLRTDLPKEAVVPAATVTEPTLLERVNAAIDKMNEGDRLVFILYEFEGLPGKQIAAIAGCPEATVWRRLHFARRAFRDMIGNTELEAEVSP